MSNDEKTDRRFAMIVAEMSYEPEPSPPTDSFAGIDRSTFNEVFPPPPERKPARTGSELIVAGRLKCPRCELEAFELLPALPATSSENIKAACLGCPPPALMYAVTTTGIVLRASTYRCSRCGNKPRVTMTLSEVNLHCRRCSGLTLHVLQEDPKPAPPRQVLTFSTRAEKMQRLAELIGNKTVRIEDVRSGVTDVIRMKLGLMEFDEFERRAQDRNIQRAKDDPRMNDLSRGTGRSWRGLLEALVECQAKETRRLWVMAATRSHGINLCEVAIQWSNQLGLALPVNINVPDADQVREKRNGLHPNVTLHIDHSLFNPGLMYKPDF